MKLSPIYPLLITLVIGSLAAQATDSGDALATLQQAIEDPSIDFEQAYEQALESGVAESVLIESKLIKYMGEGRLGDLIEMIPTLESKVQTWEYAPGKLFTHDAQLLGMIHSLKAIQAQYLMENEAFEYHAKEAFWNSPDMASVFSLATIVQNHQNKRYQEEMLTHLIVPMETEVLNLDGERETLASILGDQKAILLDFWASWCGPCIKLMPQLKHKANMLAPAGIRVVALNTDQTEALDKAKKVKEQFEMSLPWYVEPASAPLSKLLYVDSIPRMVLLSPEGNILFSGHPMDPELLDALEKLSSGDTVQE
jgi:thiol-disulfide isomerase/thioredoxin